MKMKGNISTKIKKWLLIHLIRWVMNEPLYFDALIELVCEDKSISPPENFVENVLAKLPDQKGQE